MKKSFFPFLLTLGLLPLFLIAQDELVDTAMMGRIRAEGLNHSQVPWLAHNLTDVSGPRLTNSSGYRRAAQWVLNTLKSWGIEQAKLEPWGEFGYGWDVQKATLALKSPYYESLIAYPRPWCGSTNGGVSAELVLLDSYDSAYIVRNASLWKGKIVLLNSQDSSIRGDFTADASRYTDSQLVKLSDTYMFTRDDLKTYLPRLKQSIKRKKILMQTGVLGIVSSDGDRTGRDGTVFVDGQDGHLSKDQPRLPEMVIANEAFYKIKRLIRSGHKITVEMNVKATLLAGDKKGYNVIGELPGTDPTLKPELVMLGGHLDSWQTSTGATDNAAGCIASLEAIRILKTLGVQPRRTIRIALWGGEEQGLIGSYYYIKNHFGDPATMVLKPEQQKISAYFNLDNGSGKIRGIFSQGNDAVIPIFKKWLEPFADLGATTVTPHYTGSTDHYSFDLVGIPGFQFIQDPLDYETRAHHSNMDNFDHLLLIDLEQASVIMAAFVYNTAMRTDMLPRKPLPKPAIFLFAEWLDEDF